MVLIVKGIITVHQAQVVIVERFGKFHGVLYPGINWIIPLMDKPHIMEWRNSREYMDASGRTRVVPYLEMRNVIDLRETVYDFPRQSVITKDNATIEISAVLYFQITDPIKAAYEVESLPQAIEKTDADHPAQYLRRAGAGPNLHRARKHQQQAVGLRWTTRPINGA